MSRYHWRFAWTWLILVAAMPQIRGDDVNAPPSAAKTQPTDHLVIHEWGTFTCLQDESGKAIFGINTDDEAVPAFVHRISDLIPRPTELAPVYYKGAPRSHRQVQMRLETPVVYFHPPGNPRQRLRASLQVDFRGGWLTEYYPTASVSAPGLKEGRFRFAGLTPQTRGSLEWHDLTIGSDARVLETDAQVWLAPRAVDAATVQAPGGEAEKYLFYRGVGNIPSPVTVVRTSANDGLVIREDIPTDLGLRAPLSIRAFWLVHIRGDGLVAYRSFGAAALTGEAGRELLRTPLALADELPTKNDEPSGPAANGGRSEISLGQYSGGNLARLRKEMRTELIADGLYDDEADAMLRTWELAYFKSPGLRLFYVLPHQWTEAVLPMKCSLAADISRTMVGRIELVTPQHRSLIRKISASSTSTSDWFYRQVQDLAGRNEQLARLWEGEIRFQDLKLVVPRDYQAYIDLGRFRNALILDEFTRHPEAKIRRFVDSYRLGYYTAEEGPDVTEAALNR